MNQHSPIQQLSISPVSIVDHNAPPYTVDEMIFNSILLNRLTRIALERARQYADDQHHLPARATLQRAVTYNQSSLNIVHILIGDSPPDWEQFLDMLEDSTLAILDECVAADRELPRLTITEPTGQPALDAYHDPAFKPPETHDTYWQWIQTVAQSSLLAPAIAEAFSPTNHPSADASPETRHGMISAAVHAVNAFTQQLANTVVEPHDYAEFNTIPQTAQALYDEASQALQNAANDLKDEITAFHQASTLQVHPSLHDELGAIEEFTETPIPPGKLRTVIRPGSPEQPPLNLVVYNIAGIIHVHPPSGPYSEFAAHRNKLFTIGCIGRHVAHDATENNIGHDDATPDILHALSALLNGFTNLTPTGTTHIAQTASRRQLSHAQTLRIFSIITSEAPEALPAILRITPLSPTWCDAEDFQHVISAARNAGADDHLVKRLIQAFSLQLTDFQATEPTIPQPAIDEIAEYLAETSIPVEHITEFQQYNDPKRFRRHRFAVSPQPLTVPDPTHFDPPQNPGAHTGCPCSNCDFTRDPTNSSHPSLSYYIRNAGYAHAYLTLAEESPPSDGDNPEILRSIYAAQHAHNIDRLDHFLTVHQAYPNHPFPMRLQFIRQCRDRIDELWPDQGAESTDEQFRQMQAYPRTPHFLTELDVRTCMYAAAYHRDSFHHPLASTDEKITHAAEATQALDTIVVLQEALADQFRPDPLNHRISQHENSTYAIAAELTKAFVATIPHNVTPDARLLLQKDPSLPGSAPIPPTHIDFYEIEGTDPLDYIVVFYHQEEFHFKTLQDPYPPGYPQHRALQDMLQAHRNLAPGQANLPHMANTITRLAYHIAASTHCVQDSERQSVIDIALRHGLSHYAVMDVLHELHLDASHQTTAGRLPASQQLERVQQAVIDAARKRGFNDILMNRIAEAIVRPDLIVPIPPLERRHARAILKAARQAGVANPAMTRLEREL